MGLETAYTTDELNLANPTSSDMVSQGDDHLRMLKLILKNEFFQLYRKTRRYSFEKGNTVQSGEMLFFEAEAKYYEWQGTYPAGGYVVPSGSTPATAGGVGSGKWVAGKANGIASAIVMSDTVPVAPTPGLLWLDTTIGVIFVYYDDGTSFQWVEAYNPGISVIQGHATIRHMYEIYCAAVGYTMLPNSFLDGGTFTSGNKEVLWDIASGKLFKWTGAYTNGTYVVAPGTSPSSDVNFVELTDKLANYADKVTRSRTVMATATGTGFEADIPSWATKITLVVCGLSLTNTSQMMIKFKDASAYVVTGYICAAFNSGGTAVANTVYTTGFAFGRDVQGSAAVYGTARFFSQDGLLWVADITGADAAGGAKMASGKVQLSTKATKLKVCADNMTETFDAGSAYFIFED